MAQQHTFSEILDRAIVSSGLSLNDIVSALKKQGLNLSAASLSYWRTGKTLPTRKNSLPILTAIEQLCSLKPGTLVAAAQIDSRTNRQRRASIPSRTSHAPDNKRTQVPKGSEDLESNIEWEYEAKREIIIDSYRFSSDLTQIQSETTILARITSPARSYLHISSYLSDDEKSYADKETNLRYLDGATVGDIIRHGDSRTITVRLDLPEERKVGDLHRVFYLLAPFRPASPATQSPGRHFAWPLRTYNCTVVFEGDVPENIEWVTETIQENPNSTLKQVTAQQVKPIGNTVQISMENVQGILGYFRWTL